MKTTQSFKRFIVTLLLGIFFQTNILALGVSASSNDVTIVYPIQEMSELECRFEKFSDLSSNCKRSLPILETDDYEKYAAKDGGYNDYTRIYTVLWGASYKYGWDVGFGGHQGVDIATAEGTPVYSMADGTVIIAKNMLGWGNNVSVEHEINGKTIVSNYSHLHEIDVKQGDKVDAGDQIGTVGNTGNSFGNHLHFQIDLDTPFHPYYYDSTSCPYSYSQITEDGVCFDDLAANTLDPLAFLESNGAVLDDVNYTTKVVSNTTTNTSTTTSSSSNNSLEIFNTTVYIGYSQSDIKKVQRIYEALGYYDGSISGDYEDVLDSVIEYQLDTGVIDDKDEDGAGWFGPKTRAQTESDYNDFLANQSNDSVEQEKRVVVIEKDTTEAVIETNVTTQKIERENLLTREEIEALEMEEFMKNYDIEVELREVGGNIKLGETSILDVDVKDRKGKSYKGNLPASMTFEITNDVVDVFPTSLYNFNREAREIKFTGTDIGNTSVKIKIGTQVVKTINLKVYQSNQVIYPETGKIYGSNSIVVGETKSALAIMRDGAGQRLINIPYGSTYTLQANDDATVCLKTGSIENIKQVYQSSCDDDDFQKEIVFSYSDTVGGVLVFDYKATSADASMEIVNNYSDSLLSTKKLAVRDPKGLMQSYVYHGEVIDMLEAGVTDGINQGYFLESRNLTQRDAISWIDNSLDIIEQNATQSQQDIDSMRSDLTQEPLTTNELTRGELLELIHKYLVFEQASTDITIKYRDLDDDINIMANTLFNDSNTWRDAFGNNYYRPNIEITRGEAAFLLSNALKSTQNGVLALN